MTNSEAMARVEDAELMYRETYSISNQVRSVSVSNRWDIQRPSSMMRRATSPYISIGMDASYSVLVMYLVSRSMRRRQMPKERILTLVHGIMTALEE